MKLLRQDWGAHWRSVLEKMNFLLPVMHPHLLNTPIMLFIWKMKRWPLFAFTKNRGSWKIKNNLQFNPYTQKLKLNIEQIEKSGYDHFMLKEIFEQPQAILDTYRGRLDVNKSNIKMSGIEDNIEKFLSAQKITIVACGTSWHAGLVAEYVFEDLARIPVEVEYASEFRYRNPIITDKDIVIAISQSGETADTLAAIKLAKANGAFVFGVCNVVGASISREAHAGAYTTLGPRLGWPPPKHLPPKLRCCPCWH